jgi:hypothetical protein
MARYVLHGGFLGKVVVMAVEEGVGLSKPLAKLQSTSVTPYKEEKRK